MSWLIKKIIKAVRQVSLRGAAGDEAISKGEIASGTSCPRNDTIKKCPLSLFILQVIFLSSVLCFVSTVPAFAAASVSVTTGGTWALGDKAASSESTSSANAWTVTNDSLGVEDVLIKVTSTGLWTASTDATLTANEFLLRKDSSAGQIITGTDGSLVTGLADAGTNSFGLYFKAPPTGSEEGAHTLTVTLTATNWVSWACGSGLAITHTAGVVAPVTKTVTYGTVTSSLSGASKCWITQNLGATNQAASATDATEASAGWYWQFNRKQGYKHDGTTLTPAWTITSISETSDWLAANDPCTIELGTGWRLPTNTEWTNVDTNGAWSSDANAYSSVLKLHSAGYLNTTDGGLVVRGNTAFYWSSTQASSTGGDHLYMGSSFSYVYTNNGKAYGFGVRCLKD